MKDNLSTKAYEQIKKMILSGVLKQGQAISINAMTDTLQISRTPLTNACQRLEYEKFLTILPKQGVIINTISLDAARGIYELRAAIETYNAKRTLDLFTEEDCITLQASIDLQVGYAEAGDTHAFMDEDTFFHRYMLGKNNNYEMICVIEQLYERAYMLGIQNSIQPRMQQSIEEHRIILDALKRRDRQAFPDSIETNILNGFRNLTSHF